MRVLPTEEPIIEADDTMDDIIECESVPQAISIARCRELLGEEAKSMTDQEIALIRRHAETMACILVEMYEEHCRISE